MFEPVVEGTLPLVVVDNTVVHSLLRLFVVPTRVERMNKEVDLAKGEGDQPSNDYCSTYMSWPWLAIC